MTRAVLLPENDLLAEGFRPGYDTSAKGNRIITCVAGMLS